MGWGLPLDIHLFSATQENSSSTQSLRQTPARGHQCQAVRRCRSLYWVLGIHSKLS